MAHHHNGHHWNYEHDYNRNLARRFSREARYSDHPTQYIVNEGKMVIDERTLKHTNAIIYNAPGSTLRLSSPRSRPNPFAPQTQMQQHQQHHNSFSYNYPQGSSWWAPTGPLINTCRNCLQRREMYYAGYCHNCASLRYSTPYQTERKVREDRRVAFAPERKMVTWR